jgi:hypothetical protein
MIIPKELKGQALIDFVSLNKKELIDAKKSMHIKYSDVFKCAPSLINVKGSAATKAEAATQPSAPGELNVKVVCNTFNWVDSDMDMLVSGCCNKTLKERKDKVAHLVDHCPKVMSRIGKPSDIYVEQKLLKDIGINKDGSTECLIMESTILQELNASVFTQYKLGLIDQHSIGFQYVSIEMAVNNPVLLQDENTRRDYENWVKYAPLVINQEALVNGFFWVIKEIKLYENSAVLWGANEITPTLSMDGKNESTYTQPLSTSTDEVEPQNESPFMKFLSETNFLKK